MQSMDDVLDRHFGLIGARVRVAAAGRPGAVAIDIRRDGRGEYCARASVLRAGDGL